MIRVNVHEAKTHLSRFLAMVAKGETVVICNRNVPVAELRQPEVPKAAPRVLGSMAGMIKESPGVWDPLSDEEMKDWEGPILSGEDPE